MKSKLLHRQMTEVFGPHGGKTLDELLDPAGKNESGWSSGEVGKLLGLVDNAYASYAGLQHWQGLLSGDVLSEWDLKSGRIISGRGWKRLLGYELSDFDHQISQWHKLVFPDDLRALREKINAHALSGEGFFQAECRFRAKNGQTRWLLVRGAVSARESGGELARMRVLQRDVTDAKAGEQSLLASIENAETARQARSTFLANISHEIRAPINGVVGMTELVLDTKLDAEQRHYLKTIKSSADSLLLMVDDLRDFSMIEAGKMQFEAVSFSVGDAVFEAARVLAVTAHKKGLALVIDVNANVPSRVLGDPLRLRQVINHLLGNAIKFTDSGEVVVEVSLEKTTSSEISVHFSVRDTGIGVPTDKQQVIFDAFTQADGSIKPRFGGTGLGLAICARLVQMMGGQIGVESVEGKGSRFHFSAHFGSDPVALEAIPEPEFAEKRALIVEAHAVTGQHLVRLLKRLGIRVSLAMDGAAAISALEQSRKADVPFDYVLASTQMKSPGGLALAENWRNAGRLERLFMLMTSENQRDDLSTLRQLGISGYIIKPVAIQDVHDALHLSALPAPGEDEFALESFDLDPALQGSAASTGKGVLDVLLVEDNPVNQALALRLLAGKGHRVVTANNGVEAIEQFENAKFDVILMDLQMPVMGGIEASEAIRSREMRRSWVLSDAFQPMQIIAMSASLTASDRERCLAAGMNDFVAKPLRPDDLFSVLARAVGGEDAVASVPEAGETSSVCVDLVAALKEIGDLELLVNMAGMFLAEWDSHVGRLSQALHDRAAQDLRLHALTLKSLLAMFHANQARSMALEIEREAKADGNAVDWAFCAGKLDQLFEALGVVRPLLAHFVRTRQVD